MEKIIIVGAGQAGMKTATHLREYGYEGTIIMIGDEAHEPYERPPLSKDFLTNASAQAAWAGSAETLATIEMYLSKSVVSIDRLDKSVLLSDGVRLSYDRLIIATGGACRKLELGASIPSFEVRTLDDARSIYDKFSEISHVTIIGAGVIGLEVASSARHRGLGVTIIERDSRILSRNIPADFVRNIQDLHDHAGVQIHLNANLKTITHSKGRYLVQLESGVCVETDCFVVGIGIIPNTSLAKNAGLEVNNGITVSSTMQTSDPNIFAVGDVANVFRERVSQSVRIESWHNANRSAQAAAASICGVAIPPYEVPWFWTDQYGVNIQIAGWPMDADRTVWRKNESTCIAFYLKDNKFIGACAMNAGRDMAAIRRMLNAGISPADSDLENHEISLRSLMKRR